MTRNFVKMHGLGNDFVVIDHRQGGVALTQSEIRLMADRRRGVGCDQLIILEPPQTPQQALFMRIYNPDGSESEACGNATRCIAKLIMEGGKSLSVIGSLGGDLEVFTVNHENFQVKMPIPRLGWHDIPLKGNPPDHPDPTLRINREWGVLKNPTATNMGNPHVTFFVENIDAIPIEQLGPMIENDSLFPNRVNVGVAQILRKDLIRLRVWERGAGLTLACGSGACAALVAAFRRELSYHTATMILDGGNLTIGWESDVSHVSMTGGATHVFDGVWHDQTESHHG